MNLGDKIRTLRKSKKISQKMLAIRLNVSQSIISDWEKNLKVPSAQKVMDIAEVFGTTTDYLLGASDQPIRCMSGASGSMQVTTFEKDLIDAYRALPSAEQVVICRSLGLTHPAVVRDKAKDA